MKKPLQFKMNPRALYFMPLGGCGMFGANMSLYGHQGQWIMVDCGLGFADENTPGIEILVPDPSFAVGLGDALKAIVLTHAHEDHIGALQYLWPRLRKPLYATPFTAERIKQSLGDLAGDNQFKLTVVPVGGSIAVNSFQINFIPMAHSIPESHALNIGVEGVGRVLHTGDWKIDSNPVEGNITDETALRNLGNDGVLAVIGDSTNAMVPGHSGSELDVQSRLKDIFSTQKNKIIVTCFSTNVARLRSVYEAAKANGRFVCLEGRSLWAVEDAARKTGYLKGVPPFLTLDEAGYIDENKVVFVCTGSQGEPRAVLNRISKGEHKDIIIDEGDLVIFSSRAIPGNERAVDQIKNRFYQMGAYVLTDRDDKVHVSGHPYRDELKKLYELVRPQAVIPVHGEQMQLEKHVELADLCGINNCFVPSNGQILEISQNGVTCIREVDVGILAVEGQRLIPVDHETILMRKRAMYNGNAVVTVVLDERGKLKAAPHITAFGLLDDADEEDIEINKKIAATISKSLLGLPKDLIYNDDEVKEMIRVTVRRFFQSEFDRKPQVRIHLIRV